MNIVCIGECMVELSPVGDQLFRQSYAGDSYNTATYLARQFSDEMSVSYLTALGTGDLSLAMIHHFQSEGIETDLIRKIKGKEPGLYMIENDASGERYFTYWRGASAARKMFAHQSVDGLVEELSLFDAIYLSGISLAILDDQQRSILMQALQIVTSQGNHLVAFDPNHRPALWPSAAQARTLSENMAQIGSLCLVGLEDDRALMGEKADAEAVAIRWQQWGAREVVVKNGADNCFILHDKTKLCVAPAKPIKPIDTTGAGDSFAAGYVGARLLGRSPQQAAQLAHSIAGQVIQHPGGVIAKALWNKGVTA